jgi:hypothetical protein
MRRLFSDRRTNSHWVLWYGLRSALMLAVVSMPPGCSKCSRSPESRAMGPQADSGTAVGPLDPILGYNSADCITCAHANCLTPIAKCVGAEGIASGGPAKGKPRAQLCTETLSCAIKARCVDDQTTMHCYCGSARGLDCVGSKANGSCKSALESGLETTDPGAISTTFGNDKTGGGAAMRLAQCLVDHGCSKCF